MLNSLLSTINTYISELTMWLNTITNGNQFLAGTMLVITITLAISV